MTRRAATHHGRINSLGSELHDPQAAPVQAQRDKDCGADGVQVRGPQVAQVLPGQLEQVCTRHLGLQAQHTTCPLRCKA